MRFISRWYVWWSTFMKQHEAVLFLLLAIYFFIEYVIIGHFSYVRIGDNVDSFIPRLASTWSLFRTHGLTHWYPLLAGGVDRLSIDISFTHIADLLFALPWHWLAYAVTLVGSTFVAGWYTYRICIDMLGLRRHASLLGGLLVMYFFSVEDLLFFMPGIAAISFVIYYLEKLFRSTQTTSRKKQYTVAAGLGILLGMASSIIYTLPFILVKVYFWFVYLRGERIKKVIIPLGIFTVSAVLLQLKEILSLMSLAPISQRNGDISYFQAGVPEYISYVWKIVHIEWIPLLCIIGCFFLIRRDTFFRRLAYGVAILVITTPAYFFISTGVIGNYVHQIRDFDFSRFWLLVPFMSAVCVAYGFDRIHGAVEIAGKSSDRSTTYPLHTVLFVVCVLLLFGASLSTKVTHLWVWFGDGGYRAQTYSPDLDALTQKTAGDLPFRVLTVTQPSRPVLLPTLANMHGLESIDGHPNLTTRKLTEFFYTMTNDATSKSSLYFMWDATSKERLALAQGMDETIHFPLLSLANVRYIISLHALSSAYLEPVVEQGNRYSQSASFPERARVRLEDNIFGRRLYIYENRAVFPRVFLTSNVRVFDSSDELLDALQHATTTTLRTTAFVEHSEAVFDGMGFRTSTAGTAELVVYTPDEIHTQVEATRPSILVLTNTLNPFWVAYVDGVKQPVFPVYHTFIGVRIERGRHEVRFVYEPSYLLNYK